VRTFIFIAGAPGAGKSTVAAVLQRRLGTRLSEFGWIPEFRDTDTRVISYEEEESLAFENLTLVLRITTAVAAFRVAESQALNTGGGT
jgi:adenylate kinase family enzyme